MRAKIADRQGTRNKITVCSKSHLFFLFSLTLATTIWMQFALSTFDSGYMYSDYLERSLTLSIRLPPRKFVAFDEFFKKPPQEDVVSDFFQRDELTEASVRSPEPKWKCNDPNSRRSKLVYIHMYRSAGFTIRAILRAYATVCRAGIVFVSNCVDVGLGSMEGEHFWMNEGPSSPRQGKECWLSHLANRTGGEYPVENTNAITTPLLQDYNVDIFGDHLPVGALQNWKDKDTNETAGAMYLTFFRDPLEKLVSHHVFANPNVNSTIPEIAESLYEIAGRKLKRGKHLDKTSNHFMSPDQKRWIDDEGLDWTHERRANLTMKNLVNYNVLVGLVDRLPESLHLIQYTIDMEGELSDMFRFFSSAEKIDQVNEGSITTSRQHTAAIASAIRSNETISKVMYEYLKYEQQIYDFAVKVHHIQYAKIRTQLPEDWLLATEA